MATAEAACRQGNFLGAIAILTTGYEQGGPSDLLVRAYTYLQYLLASRNMLRRANALFGGVQSLNSLDRFADRYDDATLDRLEIELNAYVLSRRGQDREPSDALLHLAKIRFAAGASVDDVLSALPEAEEFSRQVHRLALRIHLKDGDISRAESLLGEPVDALDPGVEELRALGRACVTNGRDRAAAGYFNAALSAEAPFIQHDRSQNAVNYAKRGIPTTGLRRLSDMLNDLLPANSLTWREKDFENEARSSLKSGNYPRAVAILATGYERGGPASFLEWAYTYLHYLLISRRMLRRGAASFGWKLGDRMLQTLSVRYSDAFLDGLKTDLETYMVSRIGQEREPSGALLLMAEIRMADGETADSVLPILPRAGAIRTRTRFATAQAYLAGQDTCKAEPLLLQTVRENESAVAEMQKLGEIALGKGRIKSAAELFDRSLRATYAPVMPSDIAPGEVRFVSTILDNYDVYASSTGFTIIKKQPSQIGVVMLGDRLFEILNTPGYRQWLWVKRVFGRVVDFNRLRTWTTPQRNRRVERTEPRRSRLGETIRGLYGTVMRLPGLSTLRSGLGNVGFRSGLLPNLTKRVGAVPRSTKSHFRQKTRDLVLIFMRALVGRWMAAREVPAAHQTRDVQEIFRIISRIESA
ncbi:MAG: hypothetical protein AAGL24_04455 [Pseudomonadota bacterium]